MSAMSAVVLAIALVLPLSALIARRPAPREMVKLVLIWTAIFGIGWLILSWLA